jgi:hypothetical protein
MGLWLVARVSYKKGKKGDWKYRGQLRGVRVLQKGSIPSL